MSRRQSRCYLAYCFLWVFVLLLLVPERARAQAYCTTGSGYTGICSECACVGYCNCLQQLYRETCSDMTDCITIRSVAYDGGEENCVYWCCQVHDWDCVYI
jgi:hypothetical protein